MGQTTGTKIIGQPMDLALNSKKTLIQHVTSIADVFGDDRGLLKFLLTLNDDEIVGVHKFAQGYIDGLFPIDVLVEQGPQV